MPKSKTTARVDAPTTITLKETELFEKVRCIFSDRGHENLPLSVMVRIALGEWIKTNQ